MQSLTYHASSGALAAKLAILCLSGASPVVAQDAPAGTYHARAYTFELTVSGQARFSNSFGPLIVASYVVAGDTITLRDESGPAACGSGAGRYVWRAVTDSLRFRLVSDPCESRRAMLSMTWARGALPVASAAELSRIVITAQRQVEDVQRAPVAISVLSADALRDASVTQPQSLTYLVPGLQVGSSPGGSALLFMRGVGNFAGTSLQDPTVTFNFDGVYIARSTATSGLFYDLERVEVLKGPQGTLYGRNATGGAVNILPRRPVLGVFGGEMAAEYGDYGIVRANGSLNVPIGDRAAFRVAGQRSRHDAYMHDGTDDQDEWAGWLSFRYDVNDDLSLHTVADYYDQGGHDAGSTPLATGVDNRYGVSSQQGGAYYGSQNSLIAGRTFVPQSATERANNHHYGVNATMDWRTALGGLTLISASRGSHLDGTGAASGVLFTNQEQSRQNSLEARLASVPMARLQTLVGGFYIDEDIATPDGGLTRPYNQFNVSLQQIQSGVTSGAVFGRATWSLTDQLRATVGARYTQESKYFRGSFQSFQKLCMPVPVAKCPNAEPFPSDIHTAPFNIPGDSTSVFNPADGITTQGFKILANESAKFSRTTWRSALEYDVTDRAFLYASFETGFKSGGFFFSNDSQVYQPETIDAATLGVKSRLFDNRVQANLELFNWRYHDQQVSKISVDSHNATNLRTENIGQATIRGSEASFEYAPLANTRLSADVQYLYAVYDSYTFHTPQRPISGCVLTTITPLPKQDILVDCSGRHAPFAPTWTQNLEAVQVIPLQQSANLTAQARAHHQSATLTALDYLPVQEQPDYWNLDASLTLTDGGKRHSVSVFGQNLTDRTVLTYSFILPLSVPTSPFVVGALRPPRMFGIRVVTRF